MTDFSAAAMKGGQSPHAPLIERRQRKSSPYHHIICLDVPQPTTVALRYPNAQPPKLETISARMELAQKEKKRGSKSRMDPELEELKGFVDLGYSNAVPISSGKELAQKEKKSKMDPEFAEIKGFMDIGFEFTPRLFILLPGLNQSIDHENSTRIVGFQEAPFQNWELPKPNAGEVDMKEYLKLWARSVASTLKC